MPTYVVIKIEVVTNTKHNFSQIMGKHHGMLLEKIMPLLKWVVYMILSGHADSERAFML